ncbi:MAG: ABC transporter permease, partial [Candidatus Hinthialibacter sp.]
MKKTRIISLIQAVLATALIASLFLWISGYSPRLVFVTILSGAWGSPSGVMLMLTKTSLLILTGLAVALPYRAGLFNIGGEGQFLWGGMAAAVVGIGPLRLPFPLQLSACLAAGMLAGA